MVLLVSQVISFIIIVIRNFIKSRAVLVTENLFLRQQLEVLSRSQKAKFEQKDRIMLVLLSRFVPGWKNLLHVCQPDTLLRWWREFRRLHWRWVCRKGKKKKPRISDEIRALIIDMKQHNILWGAEKIRGELLKLGIKVAKRTIQKIIAPFNNEPCTNGQKWSTFLKNHFPELLACDFFTVPTVLFKTYYIFFVIKLDTRELLHIRSTDHPT